MRSTDVVRHLALIVPLIVYAACSSDDNPAPAPQADAGSDAGTSNDSGGGTDTGSAADTGGTKDTGPVGDGGLKPFGANCGGDQECESGHCFQGGTMQFCSFKCTQATAATDCPVPPTSGECNNQGYCRKP